MGGFADEALRQRNARKKAELGSEAIIAPNTTSSFRRRHAEHTYGLWVQGKVGKGWLGEALWVCAWPRQIAMRARHVAVFGVCYRLGRCVPVVAVMSDLAYMVCVS